MSIFSELWGIVDPGGDPQAINQAATACGELAEALRQVATSLDSETASLATSWKGIPGPKGENDSASAKYQDAWHKFSAAVVEYSDGLDAKKDGAKTKLQNVAAEIQNAQDQARHLVGVAEASALVGLGLAVVTFGIGGAFAEAGATAMLMADAETLAEMLGLALRAAMIAIQGLGQALLNIATRFVIGAGFAVLSEAFAKAVHGEDPFNLDNWDANDISSIIVLGMVSAGVGSLASDTTGFTRVANWMKANPVMGNIAYFGTNGFLGAALSEYAVDGEKFDMTSALGVVESTALSAVGGGLYGKYIVGGRIGTALGLNQAPDAADMPNDPAVVVPEPPASDISVTDALSGGTDGGTARAAEGAAPTADQSGAADSAAPGPAAHAEPDGAGPPASEGAQAREGAVPALGSASADGADGTAGPAAHAEPDGAAAPASEGLPAHEGAAAADGAADPAGSGTEGNGAPEPGNQAPHDGTGAQAPKGAGTAADDPGDAAKSPAARVLIKAGEVTGVGKSNLMRSTFRSPASSLAHALSFEAPPPVPPMPLAPLVMPSTLPNVPPPPIPQHRPAPPPSQLTPTPGHLTPTPGQPAPPPGQPVPPPGQPVPPPGQPVPPPGQPVPPPGQPVPPPGQPVPPGGHVGGGTFTVRPGDTLWEIARERLGNPLLYPLIERANPQIGPNALIFPGEVLHIPRIPAPQAGSTVVVVRPGDTLWGISGGNEALIQQIARINHIEDPSLIFVGQTLIVP